MGNKVHIEGRQDPSHLDANPTQKVTFNVNTNNPTATDGSVKIQVGAVCLDMGASTLARGENCQETSDQDFYLVPVQRNPQFKQDPAHPQDPDFRWFYIVSVSRDQCLASPSGGLFPKRSDRDTSNNNNVRSETCVAGKHTQQFRIDTDTAVDDTFPQWKFVLGVALKYATNHCAGYQGLPELSPCQVAVNSDPTNWMSPRSERALSAGTYGTTSLGCGTPAAAGDSSPIVHNASSEPLTETFSSKVTASHTTETTVGGEVTFTVGREVKNDLYKLSLETALTVKGELMWAEEASVSASHTIEKTIPAGDWGMTTWTSTVITFDGRWHLGRDTAGGLDWYTTAASSFPAAQPTSAPGLTLSAVTTLHKKSCIAGAASVIAVEPVITGGIAPHPDRPNEKTIAVGQTLTVSSGTWTIPGIDQTPHPSYRWYTLDQGDSTKNYIDGQNKSTLVVSASMYSAEGSYVGAEVMEEGNELRMESEWVPVAKIDEVKIVHPLAASGDPQPVATDFSGDLPDALVGEPYEQRLVVGAGSGMALTLDATAVNGLTLAADGTLSGTAAEPGDYTFTVTDTPTDGGAVQTRSFTLHVEGEKVVPVDETSFLLTVGKPFARRLISAPQSGAGLQVKGELPHGLTLDESTGLLSGTPTTEGAATFTVASGWHITPITVDVVDSISGLSADALPAARVGVPYEAQTVSILGTHPLIGLRTGSDDLDGLTLDARTGVISGTPTEPGVISLVIGDLNAPEQPAVNRTLTIVAAGADAPSSTNISSKTLAATGTDPGPPLAAGSLLLAFGLLAVWVRRRRVQSSFSRR